MKLETLAKIAVAGFGDRALIGVLLGYLKGGSCKRCREYINENKDLLHWASDKEWKMFRRMVKEAKFDITTKEVITELQRNRPDLVDVIKNHPQGMAWLEKQVTELKHKLTS